jgi:type I restriction enzyme S subunit
VAIRGSGHTPDQEHPEYWNGGIKWVSLADSNKLDKIYIRETAKQISELGIQNSSAVLHPAGTVVLSRDAGVGKSAILASDMAVSQHFISWRCDPKLNNHFLYYLLQFMKPEFERQAVGSTIKTIGLGYFKKLQVVMPPLAEQRKIAAILGTWDAAIDKAERLVAALRARKRALMQRLLTGEVRFAEFILSDNKQENRIFGLLPSDWSIAKLSNLVRQRKEWIIVEDDQQYKRCTVKLRNRGVLPRDMVFGRNVATKKQQLTREKDLIVAEIDAKVGGFGIIKSDTAQSIVSSHYFLFEILDDIDIDFLEQCIFNKMLEQQVDATGSTNYAAIRPKDILTYCLPLPCLAEQRRIASILTLCDKEIKKYEHQLKLLCQQKRGLMQRLLTGEVRVAGGEER